MRFQSWVISDKGLKREGNQDSFLVDERLGLFIVADGVGGHQGGEVASALAVETVREVVGHPKAHRFTAKEVLFQAYEEASHRIFDRATHELRLSGMGTTMVMGYVRDTKLFIANVGDSRAYLYRKPYVWQVTEDHSLINEQIRLGLLTEEQAYKAVGKNVITRSVGFERDVFPDVIEREVFSGDVFLFCSDGLTGMVTDVMMSQIFNQTPMDKVTPKMIESALENGGDDNVTVLVVQFHDV